MIPIRTGVVRDIRNQINKKITELPLGFFSEERKGDIIARVSGDVNEVETSIIEFPGYVVQESDLDHYLSDRYDRYQLAADCFRPCTVAFGGLCDGTGREETET